MSITFHINPTDALAPEAFPLVVKEAEAGECFTCIRGTIFDGAEIFYTVASVDGTDRQGYVWEYCDPAEWVEEFKQVNIVARCEEALWQSILKVWDN
jgi:hypothetical protein